ncbi:ISCps3, transposase orfA [Psychromonas sp. CNPT3]|nr:ISCps3, transposase orfA [Psychromonas sp. CNPT3]
MPKYNNPRRTWKYTNDFKVNVVQLSFTADITIKAVAEKFDIHPFMLSRWRKEYREGIIVADKRKKIMGQSLTKKALTKEKNLERENKQLKEELYVLKKWQRFLAEEHQGVIDSSKNSEQKLMCSFYYAYLAFLKVVIMIGESVSPVLVKLKIVN